MRHETCSLYIVDPGLNADVVSLSRSLDLRALTYVLTMRVVTRN